MDQNIPEEILNPTQNKSFESQQECLNNPLTYEPIDPNFEESEEVSSCTIFDLQKIEQSLTEVEVTNQHLNCKR